MPSRTRKPETTAAAFVRVLWQSPLVAVPFALFFGLLYGWLPRGFLQGYAVALVFTYVVALSMWAVRALSRRAATAAAAHGTAVAPAHAHGRGVLFEALKYGGAAVASALLAAVIVHFTLAPGILGGPRSVGIVVAFAILFAALFIGVGYAFRFHRHALARAQAEGELNMARRMQRSFLRSNFPARPAIELHAVNVSSREVSGDFYDVVPLGESSFLVCVADVSGKGVPAALLGAMLQASLRTQAPLAPSLSTIATNVNRLLCDSAPAGQFATMFLACIDEATLRLRYVNAGHNHPVLLRHDGTRGALSHGGTVVGMDSGLPFEEGAVDLVPGDRVVMYTDGMSEAMDAGRRMYGDDRVVEAAAALPRTHTARESVEALLADLRGFLDGVEPQDDVTLMVLRVRDEVVPAAPPAGAPA